MDKQQAKDEIAQDLVLSLMRDHQMSMQEALATLYNSTLYEKLQDDNTGLYLQSSCYCYEFLEHEMKYGKLC